ncbi:hypothetical protein OSB04_un000462 [Centaurea solstitialis]|uniref:F-box domain-containing protein n=1 Tax=Centaurea solstitialis TaxID=347529 RepID=A0AA38S530_9ASTR|nr:hypothetical protein OSB04_un000462 [Centaurea solstitialis]
MQPTRNWLELPSDVMDNILFRVGVCDILENAQKVCTAWRKICKVPTMWTVICMDYSYEYSVDKKLAMCKQAVDRSQGQLIDITIGDFGNYELLQYVADRDYKDSCDKMGILIGENLHELEHLELIGNNMTDIGLQAILDGCCHLKLLDLRMSSFIEFEGGLEKRCLEQIECLIRPDEALKGSQYIYGYDDLLDDPEDYEFDDEWLSRLERSFTT